MLLLATLVWSLIPTSYGIPGLVLSLSLTLMFLLVPVTALVFAIIPIIILPVTTLSAAGKIHSSSTQGFMPRNFFYLTYAGPLLVQAFSSLISK